jgi:Sortase domain
LGGRSRRLLLLDLLVVGLVVAGPAALGFKSRPSSGPPVRASGTLVGPTEATVPSTSTRAGRHHRPSARAPGGRPWHLAIPAIAVETPIELLGVEPDGTLQVPADPAVAGWYRLGTKPGNRGPAVIVGHVDSQSGPAVFYRLGTLAPRDLIRVSWESGASVFFRVYAVHEYAKTAFPTRLVYGRTKAPELRLVTCGGRFDAETGHYLDNVIVFARRVSGPSLGH